MLVATLIFSKVFLCESFELLTCHSGTNSLDQKCRQLSNLVANVSTPQREQIADTKNFCSCAGLSFLLFEDPAESVRLGFINTLQCELIKCTVAQVLFPLLEEAFAEIHELGAERLVDLRHVAFAEPILMFVQAYECLSLLLLQILFVQIVCSLDLWSLRLPVRAHLTITLEGSTAPGLRVVLLFLDTLFRAPPFGEPSEADLEFQFHGVWEWIDEYRRGIWLIRDVSVDGAGAHAVGGRATAVATVAAVIVTARIVVVARDAIGLVTVDRSRRAGAAAVSAVTIIAVTATVSGS